MKQGYTNDVSSWAGTHTHIQPPFPLQSLQKTNSKHKAKVVILPLTTSYYPQMFPKRYSRSAGVGGAGVQRHQQPEQQYPGRRGPHGDRTAQPS